MELDELIKKYESWKLHASDEIELAYVTLFLADLKNLKQHYNKEPEKKKFGIEWV